MSSAENPRTDYKTRVISFSQKHDPGLGCFLANHKHTGISLFQKSNYLYWTTSQFTQIVQLPQENEEREIADETEEQADLPKPMKCWFFMDYPGIQAKISRFKN
jgi:hypothetical protein